MLVDTKIITKVKRGERMKRQRTADTEIDNF